MKIYIAIILAFGYQYDGVKIIKANSKDEAIGLLELGDFDDLAFIAEVDSISWCESSFDDLTNNNTVL